MKKPTKRKAKGARELTPQERDRADMLKRQRHANSQQREIARNARTLNRLINVSIGELAELARGICDQLGYVMLTKTAHDALVAKAASV